MLRCGNRIIITNIAYTVEYLSLYLPHKLIIKPNGYIIANCYENKEYNFIPLYKKYPWNGTEDDLIEYKYHMIRKMLDNGECLNGNTEHYINWAGHPIPRCIYKV